MVLGKTESIVIDLTASPSSPEVIVIDSDSPEPAIVQKKRKRSKKSPKAQAADDSRSGVTNGKIHIEDAERAQGQSSSRRQGGGEGEGGSSRRRSRNYKSRSNSPHRSRSPRRTRYDSPGPSDSAVFYIDTAPAPLPSTSQFHAASENSGPAEESPKLLLPSHVSVFGTDPVQILPPAEPEIDGDHIEFLDFDERRVIIHDRSLRLQLNIALGSASLL